jgi:hypothetical protein
MPTHCADCQLFDTQDCPLRGKVKPDSDPCGPYRLYMREVTEHTISLNSMTAQVMERNRSRDRNNENNS